MTAFETFQGPGGIRVALAPMPQVESVSVGIWVGVGGRYETPANQGISHFIEHLLFKGTRTRTSRQITESIEGIGGYLNAFTSEEVTCYYASARSTHLSLLIDVLMDMTVGATFPSDEVERERGVIIEEIRMYEDQPSQVAQEHLNALLWRGHALGLPLAGTIETVSSLARRELLAYRRSHYHRGNLWLVIAGKTDREAVTKALAPWGKRLPSGVRSRSPRFVKGARSLRLGVIQKPVEQTHLAFGFPAVSRHDSRRFALKVLSVILGENMSSRLFQKLREEHGLAYSVNSSVSCFEEVGALGIQAGVDDAKAVRAVKLTWEILKKMTEKRPSSSELHRAKEYVAGQLYLGLESTSNQMMWLGESVLSYGRANSPEETIAKTQAVTGEEVRRLAAELFQPGRLALSAVSQVVKKAELLEGLPR